MTTPKAVSGNAQHGALCRAFGTVLRVVNQVPVRSASAVGNLRTQDLQCQSHGFSPANPLESS